MKSYAVIGCGFGDEGKGRVTDWLCSKFSNPLVVRFSGGHQAGHHVVTPDFDHVYSNFGCGSHRGFDTYWSSYCTVDPVGIVNELAVLRNKGVHPHLYIDSRCPITTPFDKYFNICMNEKTRHGTCGVGFGATIQRETDHYHLRYRDLFYPKIFRLKFNLVKNYYKSNYYGDHYKDAISDFINACEIITKDNFHSTYGIPDNKYDAHIFEGSQGLLLDQDFGFFPHVTRSSIGNFFEAPKVILLVTRAYQTRHGDGPMTNQNYPLNMKPNPLERNNESGYQGEFRQTVLDLDLLHYAINTANFNIRSYPKILVVTCMDLLIKYQLTVHEKLKTYKDELSFIQAIQTYLGIKTVIGRRPLA